MPTPDVSTTALKAVLESVTDAQQAAEVARLEAGQSV